MEVLRTTHIVRFANKVGISRLQVERYLAQCGHNVKRDLEVLTAVLFKITYAACVVRVSIIVTILLLLPLFVIIGAHVMLAVVARMARI